MSFEAQTNGHDIWVIGHKNPDTDSICAAISYAYLKNAIDEENHYIPKKAGSLNEETSYILNRFGVDVPETVNDVYTQLMDLNLRHQEGISGHLSLKKAWELMKKEGVVTLPVVNEKNILEGIIVNGDIAYSYMDVYDNRALGRARTQYKNIIETLNGHLHAGNEHGYFTKGKVVVASGNYDAMRSEIERDDLVILGNVKERQLIALEQYPACMIVTDVDMVDSEVIKRAEDIQCVLITTAYDTYTAARLINQSMPIKFFMTKKNLVTFEIDDTVDSVRDRIEKVRHRDFPVVDSEYHYVGMFSRRIMLEMQRKKVILVDHNERTQAVDGIEEAEILEIIDHHRIGTLETMTPIFFRNQPLGCSSTIIYHMFCENHIEIPKDIASLMLSAILSDTMIFKSPTCTEKDVQAAKALSEISGIDIKDLGYSMFEAASDFKNKSASEIFYQDFKVFHSDDITFGVAQVSAVTETQLSPVREELKNIMPKVCGEKKLDMVFLLLTNIMSQSSEVFYYGKNSKDTVINAFGDDTASDDSLIVHGLVSRKKQFIPAVMTALQAM
jgi:manganese-dependent inorganic pyrophosphatase